MAELTIVKKVKLGPQHTPTGRTSHYAGGELLPRPAELRVARYEGKDGYYLVYCDELGNEKTDTYHESLERAMEQATFEFNVRADEWETQDRAP